jgi:multidrug transporter EmrE-like cation transporter
MSLLTFTLVLIGVLLNAAAQLFLKAGTNALGQLYDNQSGIFVSLLRVTFEPHILSGLTCYVFSVGIWIIALSKAPVSIAYPMLSIGYVVNTFAAWYLLGEEISLQKILGVVIIIFGVYVLARA